MVEAEPIAVPRPASSAASSSSRPVLPILLLLLAGSGCAALIYEIVWLQLLQLVIGASAVSLGLLLAAYMGGLCLGSAILPRIVPVKHHPLKVYALLEVGVALFGLLELWGVPLLGRLYVAGATGGMLGLILRGLVAAICLLPPTLLMGGSLPAIARWLETTPQGVSWLGYLYSANIAGGVFGGLFAAFYLLRNFDMAIGTYVAAGINLAVAAISYVAASRTGHTAPQRAVEAERSPRLPGTWLVYTAIGISGLSALGAEVVWTRLRSLLLGGTVYTFAIILAVFLIGLWGGSGAGSFVSRRVANPRLALAACQLMLAAAIAWTGYTLSHSLPYWPIDPFLSLDPVFNFEIDFVRCLWAILPGTILWGASFPLALAAASDSKQDPGRLSGEIYAANTAGSIVGALIFSLWLIPTFGTRMSEQFLIILAVIGAIVAIIPSPGFARLAPKRLIAFGAAALVCVFLTGAIAEVPWEVVAYGRRMAPIARGNNLFPDYPTTVLFRGEGINSSVLIAERAKQIHFYVSGKAEASTAPLDMRLERMMGDIPGLIHKDPKTVLVVGFGAGITAGSFVPFPNVSSITICELEPFIPPASTAYFGNENYRVKNDPRTKIVYDDARHYIYTTKNKYDVITTDPIHPWIKGTSTLYSKEYYEMVKQHLNPGGVVAQWLPIYDSDEETIKTELATFFSVFPRGTLWSNNLNGDGYDLVLLGREDDSVPINVDELQQKLDRPDYAKVMASIGDVGFHSAVEFLATYSGRATDLAPMTAEAQINNDLNMRLQYIAGLGLNSMETPKIYRDILTYRKFPDGLLTGSGGRFDALHTLVRPLPPVKRLPPQVPLVPSPPIR